MRVTDIIGSAKSYLKRTSLRAFLMRWRRLGKGGSVSMVLLLRTPHTFSEDNIRLAAERAWGLSFLGGEGSTRRVIESDGTIFLQAGPHRLSFVNQSKPYEDRPEEDLSWLSMPSQKKVWSEHTACRWVFYQTTGTDVELALCVYPKVVAQILDENCVGVFIPYLFSLIPAEAASMDFPRVGEYRSSGLIPDS